MMPSTSFHTCTSSAPMAAARKVAVRSEPPRPSVAIDPSLVAPMKPVTTGTRFWSIGPRVAFTFAYDSSRISAFLKSSVVLSPRAKASKACAGTPMLLSWAAMSRTLSRSPKDTSRSSVRGLSSFRQLTPISTCSSSFSSALISSLVLFVAPTSSAVSKCRVLIASTYTFPCMAKSPAERRLLVVLPIAEQTMIGRSPFLMRSVTSKATSRRRSDVASELPPNLMTVLLVFPSAL
mmetsp:Transcript_8040/g.12872  ORF Transcript_8040/g.12872 Transcript_8040/m.12872 type:complete len:235 (-) Transcript_8040:212-916(-)